MGLVLVLLAATALLFCSTGTLAAAGRPLEARARSLRVRNALCPYTVHRLDKKVFGLRKTPVRWLEIKCKKPGEVVRVSADVEVRCKQVTYKARLGDGTPFMVHAGCVAKLEPVGIPAIEVKPAFVDR